MSEMMGQTYANQASDTRVVALCVGVHLLENPFCIDKPYTYILHPTIEGDVLVGSFVVVPFGKSNRKQLALVVSVSPLVEDGQGGDKQKSQPTLKPVYMVCSSRMALSAEQVALCHYMKDQTLCTIGDAVRAMVPSMSMAKLVSCYTARPLSPVESEAISAEDRELYDHLLSRGTMTQASLQRKFGAKVVEACIKRLMSQGVVQKNLDMDEPETPQDVYYSLAKPYDVIDLIVHRDKNAPVKLRSALQIQILSALMSNASLHEDDILSIEGVSRVQLSALLEKGLVKKDLVDRYTSQDTPPTPLTRTPYVLNDEQSVALATLKRLAESGEPKAALLHGVTGSGKTCVMLSMIDEMLEAGKGAIMLLPEIALTPHIQELFTARYGELVAVMHSALSHGERKNVYDRILSGQVRVVVGTRSAVFAPVPNLGMIIIDEEQEHTYKSDMNPKYHARDIARFRCAYQKALMLLASATPSLESYYKATEGKYTLIQMKQRYGKAVLPRVEMVDMRREATATPLSRRMGEALVETWQKGNQSVLFLNRRGYSTQVVCRSCGEAVQCPRCSVTMHFHTRKGDYFQGELVCHLCGTRQSYPEACPACASPHLMRMGYGTQRLEEELTKLLPKAKVLRMDADTMSKKQAYDEVLTTFRQREADVLFGTQMVTKGHDFPHVSMVGVLLADASLYLDDYRAGERTFDILTQVIGRAGRGDIPGVAVIQSMNPDHDVIKLACAQDYEKFYQREIKLRRLLVFPPFCDMVIMTLSCRDEKTLQRAVVTLDKQWREKCNGDYKDVLVETFGPFEAPVYRVDQMYRMRMVVKCRLNKRSRGLFAEMLSAFPGGGKGGDPRPVLSIDFNPSYI